MTRVLVGNQLIGDRLMQTPTFRKLKQQYPDDEVWLWIDGKDPNPQVAFSHRLIYENPYVDGICVGPSLPDINNAQYINIDSLAAYNYAVRNNKTISQGIGNLCGVEIGDNELQYDYVATPEEEEKGKQLVQDLGKGKPVVAVFRHSASCSSNDPKIGWANKCLANFIWVGVAQWLQSEGYVPVALGGEKELKDIRYRQWAGERLYGENIRTVAAFLKYCKATLAVDTGGRHLAAAVGCNMMCISGTINLAQIRCQPVKETQKIFETYEPLQNVSIPYVIDKAKKVL